MTTVWNARSPADPHERRAYGWRSAFLGCQFPRDICFANDLIPFRTAPEWNITGSQRGMGRLGGDIWEVLSPWEKPRTGRHHAGGNLVNRFPELGDWGQLVVRTCFLASGREGAISTVMFEALREAVQDCEARIAIEEALLDDARRARLGDDLAARAQAVLDERTWLIAHAQTEAHWFFSSGFLGRQDRLYATAAEVAGKEKIHHGDTEGTETCLPAGRRTEAEP